MTYVSSGKPGTSVDDRGRGTLGGGGSAVQSQRECLWFLKRFVEGCGRECTSWRILHTCAGILIDAFCSHTAACAGARTHLPTAIRSATNPKP